jgi:1-acyl-sn-glycerol-3-phosphate acyltransferase
MGWKAPNVRMRARVFEHKRVIMPFPHTTYWDFIIVVLYMLAYPDTFRHFYTVTKPQPFKMWNWFLEPMGFVRSSRLEDRGSGTIERMYNNFKDMDRFYILISPEGKLTKNEWRTGFMILAEKLNCDIVVAGMDFEKKELVSNLIINRDRSSYDEDQMINTREEDINKVKMAFSEIIPLYKNGTNIPILRVYNKMVVSVVNCINRQAIMSVIFFFTSIYISDYTLTWSVIIPYIAMFYSSCYRVTYDDYVGTSSKIYVVFALIHIIQVKTLYYNNSNMLMWIMIFLHVISYLTQRIDDKTALDIMFGLAYYGSQLFINYIYYVITRNLIIFPLLVYCSGPFQRMH